MQREQTVFEMAEEVLVCQAENLAHESGHSFERALEILADTTAGRQLRELATGEHRHEKARDWQASMLWDRAEKRLSHLVASGTLPRFAAERPHSWFEGYMEWLEGKGARFVPLASRGRAR